MITLSNRHYLLLFLIFLPLSLLLYLNTLELRAEEPRRAVIAMEMMINKNYLFPTLNGLPYYNKPPLFTWVLILFFKVFNSTAEWVVRLPGVLSILGLGLAHYFFTKKYVNSSVAFLSSIFFLTSADLYFFGAVNAGEIDLFFSLLTYLQVILMFHFFEKGETWKLFIITYFIAALGVLTKGPPSLLFQGITLLTLLVWRKKIKLLFSIQHLVGILILIILVGGYFKLYQNGGGDAQAYMVHLFKEATMKSGFESKTGSMLANTLLFPLNLLKVLLPWSVLGVFMFNKKVKDVLKSNPFITFSILFFLFNIPVYWITGKPANRYIYMFFPFLFAVIVYVYQHFKQTNTVYEKWIHNLFLLVTAFSVVSLLALPFFEQLQIINNLWLKAIGLGLIAAIIFVTGVKNKANVIFCMVALLINLRIALDFFYYPTYAASADVKYRKEIEKVLEITKGDPVYFTGYPNNHPTDVSIGSITFVKDTLKIAPLVAYQVPYYLMQKTHTVMHFSEHMEKGKYYLVYARDKNPEAKVLYQFREGWQPNVELCLVILP